MNTPFYISGRERTNPPSQVSPSRYQFISLKDTEPNLGVPLSNAIPASATWILTTNSLGNRYFATTLSYDSVYSTLRTTSGNYVSVFTTVQSYSGSWRSAYTTLNTNSGTWLTVTSANSLYFKLSGGTIEGDLKVQGNVLIVGSLSALSGLEFITTRATTTSSLSIVNVGIGPALYVSQDGFYDIAKFYDAEGGISMLIGNISPPGAYTGVIGIRTEAPNKTLTVVGEISASQGFYTDGEIISAGVTLDKIIYNAVPPTLQSVFTTVSTNSAKWETVYADWKGTSSQYVSYNALSTQQVYLCAADVFGNVTIFGNLVAQGSAFFTNTIVSVTSALSVVNAGGGPALFVSQGKGSGDIASFFDTDFGNEVFHIGNAVDITGTVKDGVIGVKTGNPNKTLTVVGEISSTGFINESLLRYNAGNVIVGRNINQNIAGINNVAIGSEVGTVLDFGQSNVLVGYSAGKNVIDGSYNVIVGHQAGDLLTQGTSNVLIGSDAGSVLETGNFNIGIGPISLINVSNGGYNIGMGYGAGGGLVTGNLNIFIGNNTTASDTSRSLAIGNNAIVSKDFQAVIGDPTFPFVDGIYHGNMSFYGTLTSRNFNSESLSANNITVFNVLSSVGRTALRNTTLVGSTIVNNLSSSDNTVRILGNQTITGALSVTTLSATNIVGFYSLLPYQTFTGNGVQTDFVLLSAARSINDIMVFVSGVYQSKNFFTLITPNLLRFSDPPPNTSQIEVVYQRPAQIPYSVIPLPADGTIQNSMLANRIITSDKIALQGISGENIDFRQILPNRLTLGAPFWSYNNNTGISTLSSNIIVANNITSTGPVAASTFSGDGFNLTNIPGRLLAIRTYTTHTGSPDSWNLNTGGTYTWNKPAGCRNVLVYVTGGGGGGRNNSNSYRGAGGGGGGTAIRYIDVTSISSVTITVGGGGGRAYNGGRGATGGTSSFGTFCTATGGIGGFTDNPYEGGQGGAASGGDFNLPGGAGEMSHDANREGGGGQSFWFKSGSNHLNGSGYHYNARGMYGGGGGSGYYSQNYDEGAGGAGVVVVWEYT